MKYTALRALLLPIAFAALTTGCYYDPNYDVGRVHDIYRQDYKYKVPPDSEYAPSAPVPASSPAPQETTPQGVPAPGATPAVAPVAPH